MISATALEWAALVIAGYAESAKFFSVWLTWWLGDVNGQLLATPFIVLWFKSSFRAVGRVELQRSLDPTNKRARSVCVSGRSAPLVVRVVARSEGHGNGFARPMRVRDLGDALRWRSFRKDQTERFPF